MSVLSEGLREWEVKTGEKVFETEADAHVAGGAKQGLQTHPDLKGSAALLMAAV